MSSIRDLAIAKLKTLEAGQAVGQRAGQQVSHLGCDGTGPWDSSNPQKTAKNMLVSQCPTPIGTGRWDSTPKSGAAAGTVGGTVALRLVKARLRECRAHISNLDRFQPLHDIPTSRWDTLFSDVEWLFNEFAESAFSTGWDANDLFGLWWSHGEAGWRLQDGYGGIADRLMGSRSLKMTAERAHWSNTFSQTSTQFNRGAYHNLRPFWENLA